MLGDIENPLKIWTMLLPNVDVRISVNGYYVAAGATSEQLEAAETEIAEIKP